MITIFIWRHCCYNSNTEQYEDSGGHAGGDGGDQQGILFDLHGGVVSGSAGIPQIRRGSSWEHHSQTTSTRPVIVVVNYHCFSGTTVLLACKANFVHDHFRLVSLMLLTYSIAILFSSPLFLCAMIDIINPYLQDKLSEKNIVKAEYLIRKAIWIFYSIAIVFKISIFCRFLVVVASFLITFIIPRFDLLVSINGSICSFTLAIIIPSVLDIVLWGPELPRSTLVKDVMFIIAGIMGFICGTSRNIFDIIQNSH